MRSAVFAVVAALGLAACQTISGPGLTSGRQEISTPITLGNAPVVNGRAYNREFITAYKQGHSGSISVETESRIDVQRVGSCLQLRTEVKKVKSDFQRIMDHWASIYQMQFSSKIGETINYEADLQETQVTATVSHRGNTSPKAQSGTLMFNILVEQLHLGGETVAQDAVLLRYRLGDLVPGLDPAQAELAYALRAVGQGDFKGRPVVVAEAEGHVWSEDRPMAIDATVFIDIETGVSIHADTRLRYLTGDEASTRIRIVRELDPDYGATLAARGVSGALKRPEPAFLGSCFNDI